MFFLLEHLSFTKDPSKDLSSTFFEPLFAMLGSHWSLVVVRDGVSSASVYVRCNGGDAVDVYRVESEASVSSLLSTSCVMRWLRVVEGLLDPSTHWRRFVERLVY